MASEHLTATERLRGCWYRMKMRVGHRFGWCFPEDVPIEAGGVWCHWCGMRGRRPDTGEAG